MTTPNRPPSFMDRVREAPKLVKIGVPIVLVVVIVGAATSGGEDKSSDKGSEAKSTTAVQHKQAEPADDTAKHAKPAKATEAPATPAPKPSWKERIQDALGDEVSSDLAVGNSEVLSVSRTKGLPMIVKLSDPKGGFEGPSTDDTDALASAALAKVYGDAGWRGAAMVEFFGQLVDTQTGQQSGSAVTAAYKMSPGYARQIDWSDEEALFRVNWDLYRVKCLYLKGCE